MPEGYYLTCDDAECADCFARGGGVEQWERDGGFEEWAEPLSITQWDESDGPTHCVTCGIIIGHGLTTDGYRYIVDAIVDDFSDGKRNPVTQQWIDYYGDGLDSDEHASDRDIGTLLELHALLPLDRGEWATKYLAHIDTEEG